MRDANFGFRAASAASAEAERIWKEVGEEIDLTQEFSDGGKNQHFSDDQRKLLTSVFEKTRYPNATLVNKIANLWGLGKKEPRVKHRIEAWFDRQRIDVKRQQLAEAYKEFDAQVDSILREEAEREEVSVAVDEQIKRALEDEALARVLDDMMPDE